MNIEHLSCLENVKKIRTKQRQDDREERHRRDVSGYNWQELVESCKLASLTVAELDKYLDHHGLCQKGRKDDKMRRITAHHYVKCGKSVPEDHTIAVDGPIAKSTDSEGESESDNDTILYE